MAKTSEVTLETVADGRLEERFQQAMDEVLENIQDPTKKTDTMRKITIELKMTPTDELRERVATQLNVKTKLAPPKPVESPMWTGRRETEDGEEELVAVVFDPRQRDMFTDEDEDDEPDDVLPMDRGSRTGTESEGS